MVINGGNAMNIPERVRRYFQRNQNDFDELMQMIEHGGLLFDSPALSLLYGSYASRKCLRTIEKNKNKACVEAVKEKK